MAYLIAEIAKNMTFLGLMIMPENKLPKNGGSYVKLPISYRAK